MEMNELKKFLLYCGKEGYAALSDEDMVKEGDGSTSIHLSQGLWKFHDNYFGGEPYGGREVVFYEDKPVWIMAYYGRVDVSITDRAPVYRFLRKALGHVPDDAPYRGPREFIDGSWVYKNTWDGSVESFSGEEMIIFENKSVYSARYIGGLVDQI